MLIAVGSQAFSQTFIRGKVQDAQDGSPVSYASIRLKEKSIGTTANAQGEFVFSISSTPDSYTLQISCVGYKSYELALSDFIENKDRIILLTLDSKQLNDVLVLSSKFDLQQFMKEVIRAYRASSPTNAHVSMAYYQEITSVERKPMILAEGKGYSVYLGEVENFAPRSNYKFVYDQVVVNKDLQPWIDYVTQLGKKNSPVLGGSVNLNNFRNFELTGPLSGGNKKFKFTLDSTYQSNNGLTYLIVKFRSTNQAGRITVCEENLQVCFISNNADESIWSTIHDTRIKGSFTCTFNYVNNIRYPQEMYSYYQKGNVTHVNKLTITTQKFDKLTLNDQEYWLVNDLSQFTLQAGKEVQVVSTPYDFTETDHTLRKSFMHGFKGITLELERRPDYQDLLAKLKSYF